MADAVREASAERVEERVAAEEAEEKGLLEALADGVVEGQGEAEGQAEEVGLLRRLAVGRGERVPVGVPLPALLADPLPVAVTVSEPEPVAAAPLTLPEMVCVGDTRD